MNEPVTEAYGSLNSIEQLKQAMYDPMGKPVVINGIPDNYVPQKTEENALKNKVEDVLSVIFIIYFIAAIVGGMGLGEYDKLLGIACFGSLFLVVGLIVTFKTIGAGMNPLVLLFPYIGALMTGIPIYNIYCRTHPELTPVSFDSIVVLIMRSFCVVGAIVIVFSITNHFRRMARCSEIVDARCIFLNYQIKQGHDAAGRSRSYRIYSPTWQYEKDGTVYVTSEFSSSNFETARVGSFSKIRIDPRTPWIIYRPNKLKVFIPCFIGVMFIVLPLVALRVI